MLDIDECLLGISKCSQQCVNLPGSYVCTCRKGFALKLDNKTCESKYFIIKIFVLCKPTFFIHYPYYISVDNVLQIKRKTSYLKRDILTGCYYIKIFPIIGWRHLCCEVLTCLSYFSSSRSCSTVFKNESLSRTKSNP